MKAFTLHGRRVLILMCMIFLMSCSRLPVIRPVDPSVVPDAKGQCRRPFLDTPYRFIHSIEVSFPGGKTGTVIGITVFDPTEKTIHSVIMTLEGFVLFDARCEKEVRVNRAVPPFNADQFAPYMMEDVRLIFLAPDGKLLDSGVNADGATVCRYQGRRDATVDVIVHNDGSWGIEAYNTSHELLRKIRAVDVRNRIPGMVELRGFGFREYSLRLKLISAEPVSYEANRIRPGKTPDDDE
ncbi:MAG TPA: hypothetical protein DDY17_00105 [Syntrophaceae bacterium]|jgi:hypothetical protein|nr:hypothetical protein [Syntrophaceae bacterium]